MDQLEEFVDPGICEPETKQVDVTYFVTFAPGNFFEVM